MIYHLAGAHNMKIKPWVAVLVISASLGAVVAYAINKHGLPMICYKDNQKEYPSPGKHTKAVTYYYNCRQEIVGMDFGPYGWARTGIEIIPSNSIVTRKGFPPVIGIYYTSKIRSQKNKEKQPPVRVEWDGVTILKIYHAPGTRSDYNFGIFKHYSLIFKEDENL